MLTKKQKQTLLGFAAFLLLMVLAGIFIGKPMLTLISKPGEFRAWVDARGAWGRLAFIGMMVFQVFVALIPGEPLEIGAGYAFGFWEGTMLCLLGAVIGSALVFVLVRKLGKRAVSVFFGEAEIKSLEFLKNEKKRDALMFLLILIPGTPKDLLGYFAGLTKMPFSTWLFITAVARIPSIATSTVGGDALGLKQYGLAALALGITLVISLVGLLLYRKICEDRGPKPGGEACTGEPSGDTMEKTPI